MELGDYAGRGERPSDRWAAVARRTGRGHAAARGNDRIEGRTRRRAPPAARAPLTGRRPCAPTARSHGGWCLVHHDAVGESSCHGRARRAAEKRFRAPAWLRCFTEDRRLLAAWPDLEGARARLGGGDASSAAAGLVAAGGGARDHARLLADLYAASGDAERAGGVRAGGEVSLPGAPGRTTAPRGSFCWTTAGSSAGAGAGPAPTCAPGATCTATTCWPGRCTAPGATPRRARR
jgi:hypothetical protein